MPPWAASLNNAAPGSISRLRFLVNPVRLRQLMLLYAGVSPIRSMDATPRARRFSPCCRMIGESLAEQQMLFLRLGEVIKFNLRQRTRGDCHLPLDAGRRATIC